MIVQCLCGCGNTFEDKVGKGQTKVYFQDRCRQRMKRAKEKAVTVDSKKAVTSYTIEQLSDTIIHGDALTVLQQLPEKSVQMCVTSPPYYQLRDYGTPGQIGLEKSLSSYIKKLVLVFREVRRVLKDSGTCWINLGDTFAGGTLGRKDSGNAGRFGGPPISQKDRSPQPGFKKKNLMMVPARVAIALQEDGWWLRSDIVWHKSTAMPEPATVKRPTRSHEYLFLLAKSEQYYYDADAIMEPLAPKTLTTFGIKHRPQGNDALGLVKSDNWGRSIDERKPRRTEQGKIAGANKKSVWSICSQNYPGSHFATFPLKLVEPCVRAGSRPGDLVLDPFMGSGTVALVARQEGRHYLGIELNDDYVKFSEERLAHVPLSLWQ